MLFPSRLRVSSAPASLGVLLCICCPVASITARRYEPIAWLTSNSSLMCPAEGLILPTALRSWQHAASKSKKQNQEEQVKDCQLAGCPRAGAPRTSRSWEGSKDLG